MRVLWPVVLTNGSADTGHALTAAIALLRLPDFQHPGLPCRTASELPRVNHQPDILRRRWKTVRYCPAAVVEACRNKVAITIVEI